jgi:hypothetical protein
MDLEETGNDGMNWVHVARDRDQWRILVNIAIDLRVPYKERSFLTSWVNDYWLLKKTSASWNRLRNQVLI